MAGITRKKSTKYNVDNQQTEMIKGVLEVTGSEVAAF